jgi:3-dehydro-L-gulonate 2-dehydrogenase
MSDLRIPYQTMIATFREILLEYNFSTERAELCATLFAKASLDGVASHGLNRFPLFLKYIQEGYVDVNAKPERTDAFGSFERWNGNLGPGNLNAHHCMGRAIELAKENGLGCVALKNTNHWMRGGDFGWQAVDEGCIGLCFTNTKPNMPAWGGSEPVLGNNPVVIAVPRKNGPVVIDMALAQFSYGKMHSYKIRNEQLPFDGGFDADGNMTKEPQEIIDNEFALPIGLWKGAGLSLVLDMIVSVLSGGNATHDIGEMEEEYDISQFFLCFYPPKLGTTPYPDEKLDAIINNLKSSSVFKDSEVRYPGEATLARRRENLEHGVPVEKDIWEHILTLGPKQNF